ncbi:MAG: aminoglycoside phosphotransferase family protein [Opitutales bacterium]|jgi:hypothetical protein
MDFPKEIAEQFRINGSFMRSQRWGSGNVNDTFLSVFLCEGTEKRFVCQRINHLVFKDPEGLMENVRRVTDHLRAKAKGSRSLRLIDTPAGEWIVRDERGNYWRAYEYVEDTESPEYARDLSDAYEAAKAFGAFQRDLIDLPGPQLRETIPEFHHTLKRLDRLIQVADEDPCGRAGTVMQEISFLCKRRPLAEWFEDKETKGDLPRRVVHNDTKLNNVMFDRLTGKAVCVVDLDTVMPGLISSDFGDLARSAAASAMEDEPDLDKMFFRLDIFEALAQGYLEAVAGFLTPAEQESLSLAPMALTLELATRFLSDYIAGDVYFKTLHPQHNLVRARAQTKLLSSMEDQREDIRSIVKRYAAASV